MKRVSLIAAFLFAGFLAACDQAEDTAKEPEQTPTEHSADPAITPDDEPAAQAPMDEQPTEQAPAGHSMMDEGMGEAPPPE